MVNETINQSVIPVIQSINYLDLLLGFVIGLVLFTVVILIMLKLKKSKEEEPPDELPPLESGGPDINTMLNSELTRLVKEMEEIEAKVPKLKIEYLKKKERKEKIQSYLDYMKR